MLSCWDIGLICNLTGLQNVRVMSVVKQAVTSRTTNCRSDMLNNMHNGDEVWMHLHQVLQDIEKTEHLVSGIQLIMSNYKN